MSGATHQKPSIRMQIESMTGRGVRPSVIANVLKCDLSYAERIAASSRYWGRGDHTMPDVDDTANHVASVMEEGGFPAAVVVAGRTFHITGSGKPWRHRPAWMADV